MQGVINSGREACAAGGAQGGDKQRPLAKERAPRSKTPKQLVTAYISNPNLNPNPKPNPKPKPKPKPKPNPSPNPNPDQVLGTEKGERLAANRFSSTNQVVDNAIGRRRQELCVPF